MIILYRDAVCPFLSMTNAIYAIDRAHAGGVLGSLLVAIALTVAIKTGAMVWAIRWAAEVLA
jgi:hypothetical protein